MLRFITPPTLGGLNQYWEELKYLHKFVPYPLTEEELRGYLEQMVGELSLVYFQDLLIGCVTLEMSKRSCEIHGVVRADLKITYGRRGAACLLAGIYEAILKRVFLDLGKDVLIAKIPPESKGGLGWVRCLGFEKIMQNGDKPKLDQGRTVWRLTREKYLEEKNA